MCVLSYILLSLDFGDSYYVVNEYIYTCFNVVLSPKVWICILQANCLLFVPSYLGSWILKRDLSHLSKYYCAVSHILVNICSTFNHFTFLYECWPFRLNCCFHAKYYHSSRFSCPFCSHGLHSLSWVPFHQQIIIFQLKTVCFVTFLYSL